jgi:glycosyltransferase involved in cell wall biosynthesis
MIAASVIMINRNGGAGLVSALRTCRADLDACWQEDPCFEFILVDNGSTDDSLRVADAELQGALFPWRCITEPIAGVNFSRNTGLRAALGSLLIFTDSDLHFRRGWLRAYLAASRANPDVDVFAGRICIGSRPDTLPAWVDLDGPYRRSCIIVQVEYGAEPRVLPMTGSQGPAGPSMAFRKGIFDRYGEFDTQFGLRPGSLVAGAESEFCDRLSRAGLRFAYVPDAVVEHPVRPSQLSRQYFLRRLHGVGRVLARTERVRGITARRVLWLRPYLVRETLEMAGRYAASLLQRSPQKRFYYRGELSIRLGQIHEDFCEWYAAIREGRRATGAGVKERTT